MVLVIVLGCRTWVRVARNHKLVKFGDIFPERQREREIILHNDITLIMKIYL